MINNFIPFDDFKNASKNGSSAVQNLKPQVLNQTKTIKQSSSDSFNLSDELNKAKKQNGWLEKIFDKVKSLTGVGYSSKKIEEEINNNEDSEKIKKDIKNYRRSQEFGAQTAIDTATSVASIGVFFKAKQTFKQIVGGFTELNYDKVKDTSTRVKNNLMKASEDSVKKQKLAKLAKNLDKLPEILKNNKTSFAAGTLAAVVVGATLKPFLTRLNIFATKKYKPEITDDMTKKEKKAAKKEMAKAKRSEISKATLTGALGGLLTPLNALGGGLGAILYTGSNLLNRYFISNTTDKKEKSFDGFIETLKSSPVAASIGSIVTLALGVKSGRADKVFNENFDKALDGIKKAQKREVVTTVSSYKKLEDTIFEDEKIKSIMDNPDLSTPEKIQALSDENIFALKFKQICSNSDDLSKALKTDCPPTRTLEEASDIINQKFGGKYQAQKLVGVGTVAETYLAKDESGREVCIKILKDGIDEEKIAKDRDKFIQMIKNSSDKSDNEKEFLIENINNIAQGVINEVDFNNEAKAARELAKVTNKAKVVVPIEVKDGAYVMEKADGVSLQNLLQFFNKKDDLERQVRNAQFDLEHLTERGYVDLAEEKAALEKAQKELQEFMENSKEILDLGEITLEDSKKLLTKYNDVLIEQFSKVDEKGKTIHGDIHPGNIFIDIPAMRKGEDNFFTLIDTGNTINQSSENAIRFLNLSNYIKNADTENIVKFSLDGAKLPKGMTYEQAYEKVLADLKEAFFDESVTLENVTNDSVITMMENIMAKYDIISSDTQGNLLKAKKSANNSLIEFQKTFLKSIFNRIDNDIEGKEGKELAAAVSKSVAQAAKSSTEIQMQKSIKTQAQERKNLLKMSPKARAGLKKSDSTPKTNSKEYLTYKLKQLNPDAVKSAISNIEDMGL